MKAEQSSGESDEKGSWESELLRGAHCRFKAPQRYLRAFLRWEDEIPSQSHSLGRLR